MPTTREMLAITVVAAAVLFCPGSTAALEVQQASQPQLAVTSGGRVVLVYGSQNRIFCRVSSDGGHGFQEAVEVAHPSRLPLGARRGPRVVATDERIVVTAVAALEGDRQAGNLYAWRSTDGGSTWSGPTRINDRQGACREGLHDLAMGPRGDRIVAVWLDSREKGMTLYGSTSQEGAKWSTNRRHYRSSSGTICQCCHPSVSFDGRGDAWVLFRNFVDGDRDMYVMKSDDGGRSFGRAVHAGGLPWPLNACPMAGGSIAGTARGGAAAVWRREDRLLRVETGQEVARDLTSGVTPWLAAGADGVYTVWATGRGGAVILQPPGGKPRRLAEQGTCPVIATGFDERAPVVAAWESKGAVRVEAVRREEER